MTSVPVRARKSSSLALVFVVAACASTPKTSVSSDHGSAPPAEDVAKLSAIHANASPEEKLWHLRSGLNVAALGCQARSGPALVHDYNRFLAVHRSSLLKAHAAMQEQYRQRYGKTAQAEMDQHMTRLYNHFAWPPAQGRFCAVAAKLVHDGLAVPPEALTSFAVESLPRLDQPVSASRFVDTLRSTQMAAGSTLRQATADIAPSTAEPVVPQGWRIQLGTFNTRAAASAAWSKLVQQAPQMTRYKPRYVMPGARSRLYRLQLEGSIDKAEALRLCAVAVGLGYECTPVVPGTA